MEYIIIHITYAEFLVNAKEKTLCFYHQFYPSGYTCYDRHKNAINNVFCSPMKCFIKLFAHTKINAVQESLNSFPFSSK